MLAQVETMQLEAIGRSVLEDFLNLPVTAVTAVTAVTDDDAVPAASGALVSISGAWQGVVEVRVTGTMGRRIAALMFRCATQEVDDDKLRDALDEVANIIGGNVKALLPSPSQLSIPSFLGADATPPQVDVAVSLHDDAGGWLWIGVAALALD
ncbi:MAG: chemotaxis protein CheX [Alcanivoracaceae bacterium]